MFLHPLPCASLPMAPCPKRWRTGLWDWICREEDVHLLKWANKKAHTQFMSSVLLLFWAEAVLSKDGSRDSWVLYPSYSWKNCPGRWRTWVWIHSSLRRELYTGFPPSAEELWLLRYCRRKEEKACREPYCWRVVRHFQEYEACDKGFQDCQPAFSCLNPIQVSFWVWCIIVFGPQFFCISKSSYSERIKPAKTLIYGDNLGCPR